MATGSTYGRTWDQFIIICIFLAVFLPLAWLLGRKFDLLAFSDESAIGLGISVRQTRFVAMAVEVLLAAGAVATVGTIRFLGLICLI